MVNEHTIRYVCGGCGNIFEGKTLIHPNPDKTDWYSGFLCPSCSIKRKSADRLKELGFT